MAQSHVAVSSDRYPHFNGIYEIDRSTHITLRNGHRFQINFADITSTKVSVAKALGLSPSQFEMTLLNNSREPIRVTGAVARPGEIPSTGQPKLSQVLDWVKSSELADRENIVITSRNGEKYYLASPDAVQDPILFPGDDVFVPKQAFAAEVYVLGAVVKPGAYPLRAGSDLKSFISAAGGIVRGADVTSIQIYRNKVVIDTVNLELGYNAALKAGDVIRIRLKEREAFVTVLGQTKKQGLITFAEGMTLRTAIELAGGLTQLALSEGIVIARRTNGQLRRTKIDYRQILSGKSPDIPLFPDDLIEVPIRQIRGTATQPPPQGGGTR